MDKKGLCIGHVGILGWAVPRKNGLADWSNELPSNISKVMSCPSSLSNRMFFLGDWLIHSMEINRVNMFMSNLYVFLKCPVELLITDGLLV